MGRRRSGKVQAEDYAFAEAFPDEWFDDFVDFVHPALEPMKEEAYRRNLPVPDDNDEGNLQQAAIELDILMSKNGLKKAKKMVELKDKKRDNWRKRYYERD